MKSCLAVESIGRDASVVWRDATGAVQAEQILPDRGAAGELVPVVHEFLQSCGRPDQLALAIGPGSFTGLRIAVAALRTLAYTEALPLIPVSSTQALAVQQGEGKWWTLISLKKDTTFSAVYTVLADGQTTELQAVQAVADADGMPLPEAAAPCGPALQAKPALLEQWGYAGAHGSVEPLRALAVAQAADWCVAQPWSQVLPAYHQRSAPELQRKPQR